ncbi:MAG: non-ribosomal peptide synthetase [Candidatus Amoebophilus sp.]
MLRSYSNQDDIVVGTPIANRHYSQIEDLLGFFVNSLALRMQIEPTITVKEFIEQVGEEVAEAQLYQDLPFEKLVEELQIAKDTSKHPIFQAMFSVQSFGNDDKSITSEREEHNLAELLKTYANASILHQVAKFDLTTLIDDGGESLKGVFNYATSLYNQSTIYGFIEVYVEILKQLGSLATDIEKEKEIKIADLCYISEKQYKLLIHQWNATEKEYPREKTIQALFEEQVERIPDHVAIVYGEAKLSYREVNERANCLAHYLKDTYGIQPDDLVALCLDRSEQMLIAILAVLKAGGAYVPMDPSYPDDRIAYLLGDTNAKVVLVSEVYQTRLEKLREDIGIVAIDGTEIQDELLVQPTANPKPATTSTNLAYVIYTSGTTGKPKGVMIEHKSVNRLIFNQNYVHLSSSSVIGQAANIAFDAATFEIWGALLVGGRVVIISKEEALSIEKLGYLIKHYQINTIFLTTALFNRFITEQPDIFSGLSYLLVGGEIADAKKIKQQIEQGNVANFIHVYGPTESTTFSTYYSLANTENFNDNVPIGEPIANTQVYILDGFLKPVPIGAIGELYIGGDGIARGYLNRPELTKERFIVNPFQTKQEKQNKRYGENGRNARLYKTGDLVRWLPDGNLEYIGRNDFQVKLRGYRIELGEIESALLSYAGIKQAVVLAKEHKSIGGDGASSRSKYLVGYYVSDNKLDETVLLSYLQSKLPEYMVPSALVHLEQLPLTNNGKLDRKALPEPAFTNSDQYVAPRNELEKKICQILADVVGLPVEQVGISDDFFRLGGNSILAIKLVSRLSKELNKKRIHVATIFKQSTVSKLLHYLKHNEGEEVVIEKTTVINPAEQWLSFAQERLWFLEKYEEGTAAYNIPMVYRLSNECELDLLEYSIRAIVNRHEILRTVIKEDNEGNGYQVVLEATELLLEMNKVSVASQKQLDEELKKEANHIFNLADEYPIRISIYGLSKDATDEKKIEHYISIVIHHIAFDGWSADIFLKELQTYYQYYYQQSKEKEAVLNLPALTIQYKDFALWQRNYLSGERLDKQLSYWKNKLSDYESLNLLTDKPRPSQIDYTGAGIYFELDKATSLSLRALAKQLKVSLYSVLLSGYYLMLRSYSNQDDIVVGTPIANRHYSQIEDLVGFFVNSLALRMQIAPTVRVKEFIEQVGAEVVEAQLYQDLPFEKLVEELQIAKDTSKHPIFQVMFGVQSFGNDDKSITSEKEEHNLADLLTPYTSEDSFYQVAKFDLTTFIDDGGENLRGVFGYAMSLYEEETIKRFIATYQEILAQLADLAGNELKWEELKVREIKYLNELDYKLLINVWNATDKEYPREKTIQQLFEEQVERTPHHVAIVYEEIKLSYRQLNERANCLAHYLKDTYDIQPDDLIALCLDRSEQMLIAILAVLKAGGAYVPMDPSYPDDRIAYLLEDTDAKVVLVSEVYQERLEKISQAIGKEEIGIVAIDSKAIREELLVHPAANPTTATTSTNLAYVIYTSGTTGKPKGVMIEHKGVINLAIDHATEFTLNSSNEVKNCLWYANYVFDAHVSEVYSAILSGCTIYLIGNSLRHDIEQLSSYIESNVINVATIPPALLNDKNILKLNKLVVAGEKTEQATLNYYRRNNVGVINAYGPTEVTVCASLNHYNNNGASNIGIPISNTKCYVLDFNLQPLPIGAIGELYIGGEGLSRGYLNRPELTKERFIANPFQTAQEKQDKYYGENGRNARLYKTGDLVRWLSGGNLEYIGRNDFQVKIRGYRIELGEIESALLSYTGIKQAVVLAKEHKSIGADASSAGSKYLVGYYVSDNKLNETVLLSYLQNKLPEYMVPSALVYLEELPLTINGKLDRKALPDPEFTSNDTYVAPRNELETKICQIWADVVGLPVEQVGTSDDFFRLGGNSILAIKLVSRLSKELDKSIHVATIFKHSTVNKLVHYILDSEEEVVVIEKPTVIKPEEQLLSFAQERLWFLEKYEQGTTAYNMPLVYVLSSICELDLLERGIRAIVARHEILRTVIKEDNEGTGYQVVLSDTELLLEINKITVASQKQLDEELKKVANHTFNLADELPIRIGIYELSKDATDKNKIEHYISIVIHHIAFDGWSIDIFLKELQAYYNYYLKQKNGLAVHLSLSALTIQYKDFALWQRNYLSGEVLSKQLDYWKNKLSGYESLSLITDKARPTQTDYRGADIYFELDKATSMSLRTLAKDLKVSLYSVLLSGYYLMLRGYSNQDDIVVGTPIANRHYRQIEDLLGFFVNSLALRMQIAPTARVKEFIEQVGAEVIEAQLYQDLPFEKLVEELKIAKDTSRHPIFQVMFSVQSFGNHENSVLSETDEHNLAELLRPYTAEDSLYQMAKFDLKTFIDDGEESLRGVFNYATSLYEESTIKSLIATYQEILAQLAVLADNKSKQEALKVSEIRYLSAPDYELLVNTWNATEGDFSANVRLEELIEVAAKQTPNLEAVVFGDKALTYSQLDTKANHLARVLAGPAIQTQANELIALYLDQEESLIVAILGIWKAGAAFVPIDLNYPAERVRFIVEDSGAKCIITNQRYSKKLGEILASIKTSIQVIEVETMLEPQVSDEGYKPKEKPKLKLTSDDLCYVTYTSGTTGIPKGVPKIHESVVNSITDLSIRYHMLSAGTERVALFSAYVFEPFIRQMLIALTNSQTLVIVPDAVKLDVDGFLSFLKYHRITYLNGTYSVLQHLNFEELDQLKRLLFVGEALPVSGLERLRKQYKGEIINEYGFTENALVTSIKQYVASAGKDEHCNIGRPLRNVKCYVLSQALQPLPIGAVGELYIGGIGLAKGYLNRPELTRERFIENPFQIDQEKQDKRYGENGRNARLYKTGDLVRWLPDGNLEYIGRNDFQVKIRGYRIELGEIESALLSYAGIKQAVVLAKEHKSIGGDASSAGSKYLVGYYVSNNKLNETVLLSYLQSKLPEYMVPSALVYLEELPLTINGKLDRKALPDPEFTNSDQYVAPRNELEIKLCQIWAQVVGVSVDKVGISDDFFRLGGNSILAIKLVSKLNKTLDKHIHVATIFKHTTVSKLIHYLQCNEAEEVVIEKTTVANPEKQLLSFAQERLWFIEKYEEGTTAYNMSMVYKLSSECKIALLERSLRAIVDRHEILRTVIKENTEGIGYQVVLADTELLLEINLEINKVSVASQKQLDEALKKEVNHIFNLAGEYPIRIGIYQVSMDAKVAYYLSIVVHHIAFDGWSADIFLKELQVYYNYYLKQKQGLVAQLGLPVLTIQYKDFALWQRSYLSGDRLDKQLSYWKNKLSGYENLNLLTDKPRPSQIDYTGADIHFELDKATSLSLRALAKQLKVSLYSVLLSGYYLMLRSYSNQDDIVVGTPIANRHYSQIEDLLGFFVNSLALRIQIDPTVRVKEFIEQVGAEVIEAQLHQDLPFEKLVEELRIAKDTSRHPLFQVMFGVQSFGGNVNFLTGETDEHNLARLLTPYTPEDSLYQIAKFDIGTFIDDGGEKLRGVFNYATSLYNESTIRGFIEVYVEILKQLGSLVVNAEKGKEIKIADLSYINEKQYELLIHQWNATEKEYPREKTIQALFEEQVEKTPDSIALVYEDVKLTYRELNARSNQLASYLKQTYDIKPDDLLVLCLDRSEQMLIAILAVLKSGGAYVPMDPSYPDDRVIYLLGDTKTKVVLASEVYQARLEKISKGIGKGDIGIVAVDSKEVQDELLVYSNANHKTEATSTSLAYIIYTSGTTGNPKGVMIEHRGVVNLKYDLTSRYGLGNNEVLLQFANYVFDASVEQIILSLLNGHTLVMIPDLLWLDKSKFYQYLNSNKVTYIDATPTFLEQFDFSEILNLRRIISGGEKLSKSCYDNISVLNNCKKINTYGPTEISIVASVNHNVEGNNLSIGTPISNAKCYVLDSNLQLLPIGAIGELYVGGVGVARGYLNRPELTKEKFIANPFQTAQEKQDKYYGGNGRNARLYKTGDLVRWLPDGNLEYIERNDFQVKLRGYRIELGEIESALLSCAGIKQAIVLAKEHKSIGGGEASSGSKYLVGYYVSDNKLSESTLLSYLQSKLPEYMVPSALVHLEQLPLTINGKLDRKALPDPEFTNSDAYVAPRNELETKLCRIWADVLRLPVEKVGIEDDFFRLGGNSILAIQLVSKLNNVLKIDIHLITIFKSSTICSLANYLNSLIQGNKTGEIYEF